MRKLEYNQVRTAFYPIDDVLYGTAVEVKPEAGDLLLTSSFKDWRKEVDAKLQEMGLMLLIMHDAGFAVITESNHA